MNATRLVDAWALPLALILASALSGCATFGKCAPDACRDDAKITTDIQAELVHNLGLEPNAISVHTRDHVVYLHGLVGSSFESDTAATIAGEAPGVKGVVNSIAVDN